MASLAEIRKQNPQYDDLSDQQLADSLYDKFYSDMPRDEFYKRIDFKRPGPVAQAMVNEGTVFERPDALATGGQGDILRENPSDPLTRATGALGNYVDAAMLGGADELLAGIRAPFTDKSFDQELARLEQARRDYEALNTGEGDAATVAGIVGNPLNLVGGELLYLPRTAAGRAGTAAGIGGGIGGVSGALGTEGDAGDRALGATIGGTVGAATGGAAQPGMELLGLVTRKGVEAGRAVYNTLKNQAAAKANPGEQADKLILRALMDDDLNLPMMPALARDALPGQGFVNLGGENVTALGRQATVAQGRGRTLANDFFEEQMAAAPDRAADSIRPMAQNGYYGTLEALDQTRRQTAAPLYNQAYQLPAVEVWTPRIAELMQRPSMRAAFAKAQRIAAEEGRDPTELGLIFNEAGDPVFLAGARNGQIPSTQTLDYIKRGLDDVIEQYRDRTSGNLRLDTEGRAINATRAELVGMLREGNPQYAAALDAWGGPSRAMDMLEFGRDMYKARGNPADSIRRFQELPAADQEAVRIGFVRDAVADIGNLGDNSSAYLKLFGNNNKRAVAQLLFPDEASFNRFAAQMRAERDMLKTNRTVQGGSPTARIDADKAALSAAETDIGMIESLMSGSIPRMIGTAMQRAKNFQQGVSPQVAESLAQKLFTANPDVMQATIRGLQGLRAPAPVAALRPGLLAFKRTPAAPFLGLLAGQGGQTIATPR